MSRRAVDWVLLVALTGSWALVFAHGLESGLRTQRGKLGLFVDSAPNPESYPELLWASPGDRLLELDDQDLRGWSAFRLYDRATSAARENGFVDFTVLRDGRSVRKTLTLQPVAYWWTSFTTSLVLMAVAVTLLLFAPRWHLARRFLFASWLFAIAFAGREWFGGADGTAAEILVYTFAVCLGAALTVWNLQDGSPSVSPVSTWERGLGLLAAGPVALNTVVRQWLPLGGAWQEVTQITNLLGFALAALIAVTRTYSRSSALERRQLRWLLLGCFVGISGSVLGAELLSLEGNLLSARVAQAVFVPAVPLGVLAYVRGVRQLDVDRVIGVTVSYALAGGAVLGVAVALLPATSGALSVSLGVSPDVAQWFLTMGLVLAVIPIQLALRPRLDERMFAERHRRMSGLERLADEVGQHSSAEGLARLLAERLDTLLEPSSLQVFLRDGSFYTARGIGSPSFGADSLIVRTLSRHQRPLLSDSRELDPFDRATLETLGVELVVPLGTRTVLLGFVCLGPKRSGDIYTREEMAQLEAVGLRCGEQLSESARPAQVFRRDGDFWTLASNGKEIRVRDMRGFHHLAALLREPGREFAASDLVRVSAGSEPTSALRQPDLVTTRGLGDAGEVLDAKARALYRERVTELDAELADAERCADLGRLERATHEREALVAELEAAGRGRRAGSDAERARIAVTKAIGSALERIAERHPELAAHLSASVRRGHLCAYEPEPGAASEWEV